MRKIDTYLRRLRAVHESAHRMTGGNPASGKLTSKPNTETIMTTDERMEKIEAELARVKWVNRCLVACIVLILGCWSAVQTFAPQKAWAKSGTKTLQATDLLLQDENGKTCAVLMGTTDGAVLLSVDENGKHGGGLHLQKDCLMVIDENMDKRIALVGSKEGPSLGLYDKNGKTRIGLTMVNNKPLLTLCDENSKSRVGLGILEGLPNLTLFDENEKPRIGLSIFKGLPNLTLFDENGKRRIGLGILEGGPSLSLLDPNSRLIWSAP